MNIHLERERAVIVILIMYTMFVLLEFTVIFLMSKLNMKEETYSCCNYL